MRGSIFEEARLARSQPRFARKTHMTLAIKRRFMQVALAIGAVFAVGEAPSWGSDIASTAVVHRPQLSSAAAARAIAAGETEARQLNVGVSISILDEAGNLVREIRMDGASPLLIEYARRKAQTALLFGAPTATLAADPEMTRMIGQVPNLLLVSGGVPIRFGDKVIGSIGVSGAAPADDARIAAAALAALSAPEQ
jgi:glc operon protein GlcG